ncbi:xylulokinase [Nereida sp. MMG025]|uniref:xylulokinase n=1 Tax=Nereida sp. MMG025 TaxID=2909981 RepID=UPI001F003CEC|nr:xylulokinase [Nereida sp. MMG025]MCF6444033.1 xylulokinase [Nereida sp. MMG025]
MYLGLDLGTSGLKGIIIDADQTILAEATAPLAVSRPHSGWSEQDPADWLAALNGVMAKLSAQARLKDVKAIGLSGQMHGATCLDRQGKPLRPCILWNDTRSAAEASGMDADPDWRGISGNIVFPGFTAPKMAWLKAHEPEIFQKTAHVLLPKDYLRFILTGEMVSDMSDASGTSWLDVAKRDWSDVLLAKSNMTRAQMPKLSEGSGIAAKLLPERAECLGLPSNIPVAGGGGDNAATAVGMGVVTAGQAFISLGTSGVLFAASDSYDPAPETAVHSFCHALPDTWHQMGVILACTDALNWLAGLFSTNAAALSADLGVLQAPGRALFLPYLGGERTPTNDAETRGAFVGLEHATDQAAMTRAVLEGVSFAFRDCLEALRATGTQIDTLVAVGGGANSPYWLEAIATALNLAIDVPQDGDFGGAFGAARLALMAQTGAGVEVCTPPPISQTIEPNTALLSAFEASYRRYKATYTALKGIS